MKLVVRLSTKSMEKTFATKCWHTIKKLFEKIIIIITAPDDRNKY